MLKNDENLTRYAISKTVDGVAKKINENAMIGFTGEEVGYMKSNVLALYTVAKGS
jgi:hypothetical protein